MPHVSVFYTSNLDAESDFGSLCRALADALLSITDENGGRPFPVGGVRVLAYPAAHFAVSDGHRDDLAFCWVHLRMGRGRSEAIQQAAGQALTKAAEEHFAPLLARRPLGLTVQIDEGREVFSAKSGNLHALFTGS